MTETLTEPDKGLALYSSPLLEVHELRSILERTAYKGWMLNVYTGRHEGVHMQILALVQDAFGPGQVPLDIHLRVPRVARRDEEHFLDFVLERIQCAENHEVREFFKVDRKVHDSPHAPNADRDL